MDVLGFNELVTVDNQDVLLDQFYAVISEQVKFLNTHWESSESPPEIKVFTDNIVVGYPYLSDDDREFYDLISVVADYQLAMSLKGFFIRGGVSIGELFIDKYTVYGSALLDAYGLESKSARDPRIILSEKVRELIETYREKVYENGHDFPYKKSILIDIDGLAYINYLGRAVDENSRQKIINWQLIQKHKSKVEENLTKYKSNTNIWSKYHWLASYHNYFCKKHSRYAGYKDRYLIKSKLLERYPSTLV